MIGAIIGDIVGSPYEGSHVNWVDDKNFPLFNEMSRFTDDTVLTCATADAILSMIMPADGIWCSGKNIMALPGFGAFYKSWASAYPGRGYGSGFQEWVDNGGTTINKSYANGAMMRCSPIAFYYAAFKETDMGNMFKMAEVSIYNTHNSPEALRGVLSITSAIHMAKQGKSKLEIKAYVEEQFGHMCDDSLEDLRNKHTRNIRCNLSAPRALTCFFESTDYESAIRNAVYIKGDTDTHAAIAGSIAEAFYGVRSIPKYMIEESKKRLTPELMKVVMDFYTLTSDISLDKTIKS